MTEDPIGYAGGVNVYGYCADGPVNSVDPSGLWYRRLHEGTTAEVASGMGFSQEQAAIIGKADADIDNFGVRPPYMPFGDSQSYHFDKDPRPDHDSRLDLAQAMLAEAIDLWKKGRYNEALEKLGQSLHPLQDVDAHMNWGDYDGAIWDVRGHRDSTGNSGNMDEEGIDYDPALVGQHVYGVCK